MSISRIIAKIFPIFFTFFLIVSLAKNSFAALNIMPDYFPQQQTSGILGEDHKYTVTFRGNGEAVVSAHIAFVNNTDSTMSAILLRVPRVTPQDIFSYQIIKEPICLRYETYPPRLPTIYPLEVPSGMPERMPDNNLLYTPNTIVNPHCAEYQEPNYFDYWSGSSSYQKATVITQTDTLKIELPKPVKANASGSIVLYYRASGYSRHGMFGSYNFEFETLKVEDRIRSLQVGINTDSDLYLRDAQSNVNYQMTDATSPIAGMKAQATSEAMRSTELDSLVQQIGYGSIVKSASDLQPLDSYTVKGTYASSRLGLYSREILIGTFILLIAVLVVIVIIKSIVRKLRSKHIEGSLPHLNTGFNFSSFWQIAGLSFLSSLLTAGYTLFIMFVVSSIRLFINYDFEYIVILGLVIISFALYSFIIFTPSLYMGVKKGIWYGITTFAATIFWLIFYFIILVGILFVFKLQQNYPIYYKGGVTPLMQNAGAVSIESAPLKEPLMK